MAAPIEIPVPTDGVIAATDDESIPPGGLRDSENWLYHDGDFRVRSGLLRLGNNLAARPTGVIQYDHNDGVRRLVTATSAGWFNYNITGNTWTDVTEGGNALTGNVQQQVFRIFQKDGESWLLGTNFKDAPKAWNGLNAHYADFGGTPPAARCMMILFDRIILGNLISGDTISPVAVDVSANKDFNSGWATVLVALLADTPGAIVAMEEMGSRTGAIIKSDAVYLAIAQGGVTPFRFELQAPYSRDQGPAATLATTRIGDGTVVWLAMDGTMKRFDGANVSNYGPRNIAAYIAKTINFKNINRSFVTYDSTAQKIWVVYPERTSGDPNVGVIIDERTGAIWPMRWGGKIMTAGTYATSRGLRIGDLTMPIGNMNQTLGELGQAERSRRIVLGDMTGQFYENAGSLDDGSPISAKWETGLYSLGDGRQYKTVKKIDHRYRQATASQLLSIKVGTSRSGELRQLTNARTINIGNAGPYVTGHMVTSRFMSMEVEAQATQPIVFGGAYATAAGRGQQ